MEFAFERTRAASWPNAVLYSEISLCFFGDDGNLQIPLSASGKRARVIKTKKYSKYQQQELFAALQSYYGRYLATVAYLESGPSEAKAELQK